MTFLEASQAATAAAQFMRAWAVASDEDRSGCGFHLLLHRGTINVFRSFLYVEGAGEAERVMEASRQWLGAAESGLFITAPVHAALSGHQLHNRLRLVGDTGPKSLRGGSDRREIGEREKGLSPSRLPASLTSPRKRGDGLRLYRPPPF